MNIEELTIKEIKTIQSLFGPTLTPTTSAFEIGKAYFIRTATYACTGLLVAIYKEELVLKDAAWIADTGRFHDALKNGVFAEIEPFVNPIIVSRGGIIDATEWQHPLPREQK